MDFYETARHLLRNEMAARGIGVSQLAARLQELGAPEAVNSLTVKISRGRFQFAFVIQCLAAMNADSVTFQLPSRLELQRAQASTRTRARPTAIKEARERLAVGKRKSGSPARPRGRPRKDSSEKNEKDSVAAGG
jgi:hypothetical protein